MMYIKKLDWLSEAAKEAELIITDGNYSCVAFSQPCKHKQEDKIFEPLHAFMVENLMLSHEIDLKIETVKGFQHKVVALVRDINEDIVQVGDISIKLDYHIPSWAKDGDFVEFECGRIDLW